MRRTLAVLSAIFLTCVAPSEAHADGAHIALRATTGAYSLTLFTAPDPLVSGPADLSLLVEDPVTGEVLSDVRATATLTRAGGPPLSFALTRAAAGNKLMLGGTPTLPGPGSYTLTLQVERAGAPATIVTAVLPVAQDHRRRTTLLFALLLPLAAILLFLVNQQAKHKAHRQRAALHL